MLTDYDHDGLVKALLNNRCWVYLDLAGAKPKFFLRLVEGFVLSIKPTKNSLKKLVELLPAYSDGANINDWVTFRELLKDPVNIRKQVEWYPPDSFQTTATYNLCTVAEYLADSTLE